MTTRLKAVTFAGPAGSLEGLWTEPGALPRPRVPAIFISGERDRFGPPALLADLVGDSSEVVVVPGAEHFFEGKLPELERAIARLLAELSAAVEP